MIELDLFRSQNYREFLRCFFPDSSHSNKRNKLSYQTFIQRAGYSSKSFLAEVLVGKKHLSVSSIDKFCLGLRLNKTQADFFKNLVLIELVERKKIKNLDVKNLRQKNKLIRAKYFSKKRIAASTESQPMHSVMLGEHFPAVFAALGTPADGSTFQEIQNRLGLNTKTLQDILERMLEVGLVASENQRLYPQVNILDFDFLQTDQFFFKNFKRASEYATRCLPSQSDKKTSLFMTQTFSVNSKELPKLKQELKDLILSFSDQAEQSDGDSVSEICISFVSVKE